MLSFEQMFIRFAIALVLGAVLGLERELVGKESAGVRTTMLVTSGAALFTLAGLAIPYIVSAGTNNLADVVARNSGYLGMIANIVVGIGFLGSGIIFKEGAHPHGVTTAALVWTAAAIGILVGVGLIEFAVSATVLLAVLLYLLRKLNLSESLNVDSNTRK
jgi:putative Mg2+ transporter-C (MgtC) family protein